MAWLSTVDHKRIGILYMVTALVFFVIGGIEALFIRLQLAVPNNTLLQPDTYNMLFTMHGTTMIFLVAMPVLFGLANYFVPLQIGARDMAFPRLNAFSFWLVPFGGILLHFSFLAGGAPAVGWFAYAPLSETPYSSQLGVDYWALALLVLGIGSVGTSINLIVTVLTQPRAAHDAAPAAALLVDDFRQFLPRHPGAAGPQRRPGDAADRSAARHALLSHAGGGSAIMWQHIFWAFGHPEVYIVAIPAFGDFVGSHPGFFAQTDLRLRVRRRLDGGDRLPQPRRLGASHVHGRAGPHGGSVLCRLEPAHRHPDRRESAQLERDHGRRPDPPSTRRCSFASRRWFSFSSPA